MKSFIKQLILLTFLNITTIAKAATEIYFTPSRACERNIIKNIRAAKKSIDIAVYSINNDNIISALNGAKRRKIKIRIITDRVQASGRSSKAIYLYEKGFDIKVHTKHRLEHNKFAVYDNHIVSTGSFNWTNPASNKNSENCVFLTTKKIAKQYTERFEQLWELNDWNKSEKWFERKLDEREEKENLKHP